MWKSQSSDSRLIMENPIVIVDLGLGNLGSVGNLLDRLNVPWISSEHPVVSPIYILPGVGAFDHGIGRLRSTGWADFLVSEASTKAIIGLCLGMQLLCEGSDEGTASGLHLLPGRFRRFAGDKTAERILKVPHMGWNVVSATEHCPSWLGHSMQNSRYYFVHSFYYEGPDEVAKLGETNYGIGFPSVVGRGKIYGLQFHPEKSHKFGVELMSALLKEVSK